MCVFHIILCIKTLVELGDNIFTMLQMTVFKTDKVTATYIAHLDKVRCMKSGFMFMLRSVVMPVFIGLALYGQANLEESVVRILLAFSVVIASSHFMTFLARIPSIGNYVFMLSKVS